LADPGATKQAPPRGCPLAAGSALARGKAARMGGELGEFSARKGAVTIGVNHEKKLKLCADEFIARDATVTAGNLGVIAEGAMLNFRAIASGEWRTLAFGKRNCLCPAGRNHRDKPVQSRKLGSDNSEHRIFAGVELKIIVEIRAIELRGRALGERERLNPACWQIVGRREVLVRPAKGARNRRGCRRETRNGQFVKNCDDHMSSPLLIPRSANSLGTWARL
jgi:hypothetical protein